MSPVSCILNPAITSIISSMLVTSRSSDKGSIQNWYFLLSAMMELFKFRARDENYLLNSVAIVRLSVTTSLLMVM